jgi:O-methyltransferase/methyltransferase family protein
MADVPPRFQLTRMISSVWIPQAIAAAAKLGVLDALSAGPKASEAVAREAKTDPGATHRLLRALATLELVTHQADGAFELTPLGRALTADAPDSVRSWALLWGGPMMWEVWGSLAECVRTGESAPRLRFGVASSFEMMERFPEDSAHFNRSMLELTRGLAPLLPAFYDFAGARAVLDVGGGFGALLPPLLRAHPTLSGVVYDLPRCADGARAFLAKEGLAERCRFEGGDFFASVPTGADIYLLKSVIHDWDDARARKILERCRDALRGDAKLLVLEWPISERATPADVGIAGVDLNMLVAVGGVERTLEEYRALLGSAGLRVTRIVPTPAGMQLIEAARAPA